MKCICNDFRRAITGRWFLAALGLSMVALYLSIGQDTHYLLSMLSDHTLLEEGTSACVWTSCSCRAWRGRWA